MECPESTHLHAYADGEVDAIAAAQIESHVAACTRCRSLLEELEHMRIAIRQDVLPERTPAALRGRIDRSLDREAGGVIRAPSRPVRSRSLPAWGWSTALAGAAAGAFAVFLLGGVHDNDLILDELVSAHVRSLMPSRLIDVESSDHHTVKPWFAGRTDVSPVVVDFKAQGFALTGGRADYLDRHRVAVVVYRHGGHVINVFNWPREGASLPSSAERDGYRLSCWQTGVVQACAVSDTGRDELDNLVRLLKDPSSGGS
jgi:anti-sigma factor RsiW